MRYLRAAGLRATDKCADAFPACPVSISADGTPSTTTFKGIPDLITIDHYGTMAAYDIMVTHASEATDAATRPLHAAEAAKSHKRCKYSEYKDKCRAAGIVDASLNIPVKPLMFGTFGADGPAMLELTRQVRRRFSAQTLDLDDPPAEAFFHSTWAYQISVTVMRGTADIIYNVPWGEAVPARFKHPTKNDQVRLSASLATSRRPFRGRPRGSRGSTSPSPPPPLASRPRPHTHATTRPPAPSLDQPTCQPMPLDV